MLIDTTNVKLNLHEENVEKMDAKESSEKVNSATLYNFGYAAKEVIEKFQHFCCNYTTLGDAIYALLKRDKLLHVKYRFINTPVTYQMLARPTSADRPLAVRAAMLAMHKYTKEGRYKSVADAIEELLLGPEEFKVFSPKPTNCFSVPDNNVECTMLSEVEQDALSKIADALISRIQMMGGMEPEKKKRIRKPSKKTQSSSPSQQVTSQKQLGEKSSPKSQLTKIFNPNPDPDYSPSGKNTFVWGKSSYDSPKEITLLQNSFVEANIEPPDIEIITPLSRLTTNYKTPCKTRDVIKHTSLSGPENSEKNQFMVNELDLVPPLAIDLNKKTSSFVVNLEDME